MDGVVSYLLVEIDFVGHTDDRTLANLSQFLKPFLQIGIGHFASNIEHLQTHHLLARRHLCEAQKGTHTRTHTLDPNP